MYNYKIAENRVEGYVACRAILKWQARDFLRGISYDWCELGDVIYYYYDKRKAVFEYDTHNAHVILISSTQDWKKLDLGITITAPQIRKYTRKSCNNPNKAIGRIKVLTLIRPIGLF